MHPFHVYCNIVSDSIATELFTVTASLTGYVLLMHVNEFGQLLTGISSLLEKISRGLYYERMKLSYLCTAEYHYDKTLIITYFRFLIINRSNTKIF